MFNHASPIGNNVLTTRILDVKIERFSDPPGLN